MNISEQLVARIVSLAPSDKARAQTLGVSMRTITDYKSGKIPRIVLSMIENGILSIPLEPRKDDAA